MGGPTALPPPMAQEVLDVAQSSIRSQDLVPDRAVVAEARPLVRHEAGSRALLRTRIAALDPVRRNAASQILLDERAHGFANRLALLASQPSQSGHER